MAWMALNSFQTENQFRQPKKNHEMKKTIRAGLAMMASAVLMAALNASAISYNITSDHATGGLGTPPFGTVDVTQNGANVSFTVHLNTGYWFVLTGAADFMDFKFNATGVALGDISITQNAPYTLVAAAGAFNGDGTGNFGFGITGAPGQGNGGAGKFNSDIIFSVANATIADLTQPNNLGILFVADLLAPNGNTGPADVTVPGVPDGGTTMLMLGSALAGLGAIARRFKK